MKKAAIIFFLLSQLFTLPVSSKVLPQQNIIDIDIAVTQTISADTHPLFSDQDFLNYKVALTNLYFLSPQQLLWVNPNKPQVKAVLKLFASATDSGLNPENYSLSKLTEQWCQLKNKENISHTEQAILDTAISINLIHFLSDLRFGRINPKTLKLNNNSKQNAFTFVPIILKAIAEDKVAQLSKLVEPSNKTYQQLKKALLSYKNREASEAIKNLHYISSIRPGELSPQIAEIRQQLSLLGLTAIENNSSCLYDGALVSVIKKLQFHHGLKEDGIIGKNTFKALNTPISQYIQKIKLALERFRWLPKNQQLPVIMVNIPAFHLTAYPSDKNTNQPLDMRVIVGKSKKNKSPIFTAKMYYLEFSPYWNIPKSITFDEIIPKLQQDPLYLDQHNMELVTGFHNDEAGLPYQEDSLAQLQSGELKLRQRPGKSNSLGRVKFIFPNNYNVYLHDTPSRHLFRKSKRDLSHGCIRVEKPMELASFLLQTKRGWNQKKIVKAMQLPSPKKVWLDKAVPVVIYYSTAAILNGEVVFYNDIYHYDAALSQALNGQNNLSLKAFAKAGK
ncbi:MAG: L,D-transpeptidase family protein [Methylococcales bacterium]